MWAACVTHAVKLYFIHWPPPSQHNDTFLPSSVLSFISSLENSDSRAVGSETENKQKARTHHSTTHRRTCDA